MRIFATGATGVIGRRVVPLLIAAKHEVTAVARSSETAAALRRVGARPITVDLFDAGAVRRAIAGHDTIVNLATHIPPSSVRMLLPGAWRENDRIRSVVSRILVDVALAEGAGRFVQESFAFVYPDSGDAWIDERTPIQPARYNRSVADAEKSAARFTEHGRTGVVLRFAAFYGPDAYQVRDMIGLVRRGWAPVLGSANGFLSSVSHDDAATAVVAALGVAAGTYNVADDEPVRRREYVDSLAVALGVAPPRLLPAWTARLAGSLGETLGRSLRISNRKLRAEGGWAPRYRSVREGWRAVVEALRGSSESVVGAAPP